MKKAALALLPAILLASCSFSFGVSTYSSSSSNIPSSTSSSESSSSSEPSSPESSSSESSSEESSTEATSSNSESSETSIESSSMASESSSEESSEASSSSSSSVEEEVLEKTIISQIYADYSDNNLYPVDSCPTLGEAHLLVIPVWFSDSSQFINSSHKDNVRSDIEKAYFGSEEDTGWHSVKSYYEEESLGRLSVDGVVSGWYSIDESYTVYRESLDKTMELVEAATNWYFGLAGSKPRSYFDCDEDGYCDGVMLIYGAPDYANLRDESFSNLWAYCYWMQDTSFKNPANPGPNAFFWASYDFMYNGWTANSRAGTWYGYGDTSHCYVDAHTFIHEMGHIFGLDDYYDYYDSENNPSGGFSMQDHNVGAHDPFSAMAFGWADPYIPYDDCTISLRPYQDGHDLILLTPQWNEFDSPFDEYLLLEFYTPTGLNAFDSAYSYSGYYPQGPSEVGIRLWHIDARLVSCDDVNIGGEPIYSDTLTTDVFTESTYGIRQAFNNTSGGDRVGPLGSKYVTYNILQLIRNNEEAGIKNGAYLSGKDLFRDGDSFSLSNFKGQFPNGNRLRMNSGEPFGWNFNVSIEGRGDNLVANIDCYLD